GSRHVEMDRTFDGCLFVRPPVPFPRILQGRASPRGSLFLRPPRRLRSGGRRLGPSGGPDAGRIGSAPGVLAGTPGGARRGEVLVSPSDRRSHASDARRLLSRQAAGGGQGGGHESIRARGRRLALGGSPAVDRAARGSARGTPLARLEIFPGTAPSGIVKPR